MKKLYVLTLAALCIAACTKENVREDSGLCELRAVTESGEVKSHISRENEINKIYWDKDDAIAVFSKESEGYQKSSFAASQTGTSVVFKGGKATIDADTYAFYPYSENVSMSTPGSFGAQVKYSEQTVSNGTFGKKDNIALARCDASRNAAFKNVGSFFKFTLTQERADTVSRIEIKSNDDSPLAFDGAAVINWNDGVPTIAPGDGAVTATSISIKPSGASFASGETYYVWVNPGTFAKGITITLTSPSLLVAEKVGASALTVARNQVVDLGEIGGLEFKEKKIEGKTITFPFKSASEAPAKWPISSGASVSWAGYDNLESGLAVDNGGTEKPEIRNRKITCDIVVDEVTYTFIVADCEDAASHAIYWNLGKGVQANAKRYLGLPVIPGKKIAKIVYTQEASNKLPTTKFRYVGVSEEAYYQRDEANPGNWVPGGEMLDNSGGAGVKYTFEVTNTVNPDTKTGVQLFLCTVKQTSIFGDLSVTYVDVK